MNEHRPAVRGRLAALFSLLAFLWVCVCVVALLWLVGQQP